MNKYFHLAFGLTQSGSGIVTYTHWGRRLCPTGRQRTTHLVYEGVMAGSLSGHSGNGANPLCLPLQPSWGSFSDQPNQGAQLHGATYRVGHPDGTYNIFDGRLHDSALRGHLVPCAVCLVHRASSAIMVPAKRQCPIGWQQQYLGYLMSEAANHHRSKFVCVDRRPEGARISTTLNLDSMGLYPVETNCGSLPCNRYTPHREAACTVCTM